MNKTAVVVDDQDTERLAGIQPLSASAFLAGDGVLTDPATIVVNLCRSYEYLSTGYYVSLLADARDQTALPEIQILEELSSPFSYFRRLADADVETIEHQVMPGKRLVIPKLGLGRGAATGAGGAPKTMSRETSAGPEYTEILVVLGRTEDRRFRTVASKIFRAYQVPVLRVRMYSVNGRWQVGRLSAGSLRDIGSEQVELLRGALAGRNLTRLPDPAVARQSERIACLWDAGDQYAPSDAATLRKFERAAERRGLLWRVIGERDLAHLAQYDALFIRSLTSLRNHTYEFAQTAASLGIPVIDDPESIVRCSNKVYLHELFSRCGIASLKTRVMTRKDYALIAEGLGYPVILKVPDGSFSQAVKKASDAAECKTIAEAMFAQSPLLIAQEFAPTDYDWRVGVLEGEVLYACQYHMAPGHWQIANARKSGGLSYGRVVSFALSEVPPEVLELARSATALIGNGLYGVDVKESPTGPVVIEVNDNPNIETGCEDTIAGAALYDKIIDCFVRRIRAAGNGAEEHRENRG